MYIDAPAPASGESAVKDIFEGPYFEWWKASPDYRVYEGWGDSAAFVSDFLSMHGPFHGLLGFSQGGMLSATLVAMQQQGLASANVPAIGFCLLVGSSKPRAAHLQHLFGSPLTCPSLHFIGERDPLREGGEAMLACFARPELIRHPRSHQVPPLDDESMQRFRSFLLAQQGAARKC